MMGTLSIEGRETVLFSFYIFFCSNWIIHKIWADISFTEKKTTPLLFVLECLVMQNPIACSPNLALWQGFLLTTFVYTLLPFIWTASPTQHILLKIVLRAIPSPTIHLPAWLSTAVFRNLILSLG